MKKYAGIHIMAFIGFAFIFFYIVDNYVKEDNSMLIAAGIYGIIAGLWGNIAGIVMLKLPFGQKSYKYINYFIIFIGIVAIIFGFINSRA